MAPTNHDNHKAAWDRRFFYGANVAAMMLGVLVILVFANWLAERSAVRIDRTSTRRYSLSEQTRQILGRLDRDVTITTVFGSGLNLDERAATNKQHFRDLLDEYERRGGGRIAVEHIEATDHRALDRFKLQVAESYAEELNAARQTIEASLALLDDFAAYSRQQAPRFAAAAEKFGDSAPGLSDQLKALSDRFAQMAESEQYGKARAEVERLLGEPLPEYEQTLGDIRLLTQQVNDGSVRHLAAMFINEAQADDNTPELKSFFAESLVQTRPLEEKFAAVLARYEGIDLTEYNAIRTNLASHDSAVVMAGGKLVTVALRDVYTMVAEDNPNGTTIEQRYRSEEAVTGAVLSLTSGKRTKVVFVYALGYPATKRIAADSFSYSHLADRLRGAGMEVVDWNPAPRSTRSGVTVQPPPTAEEGQTLVWVFLRSPPLDPQRPGGLALVQVNEALKRTVEGNDPVLVMATPTRLPGDPVAEHLRALGIEADTARAVHQERLDPEGNVGVFRGHEVVVRAGEHPVSKAVAGQLVLTVGLPLSAASEEAQANTQFWPLVQTGRDTWADNPFGQVKRDPGDPTGPFTIAAASQVGDRRAVVLSDFALDLNRPRPSMYDDARLVRRLMNAATGQVYEQMQLPGNAELFVNSVYWLAGRDELIATSARSQDVRRMQNISPAAKTVVGWVLLAGLPFGCIVTGLCVGLLRRK